MRAFGTIFPSPGKLKGVQSCRSVFLLLTFLLLFLFTSAQNNYSRVLSIDQSVSEIDSLADKSQHTFYLTKWLKNGDAYKETWHYTTKEGKLLVFHVRFVIDSIEYSEIYYLDRNRLMFSEEYETLGTYTDDDKLRWGKVCHFSSSMLMHIVVFGKAESPFTGMHDGYGTLNKFNSRYSELKRHLN